MTDDLPVALLLREAAMPLALLAIMVAIFYPIFVRFTWRGMRWTEAVLWAPLAVPLSFVVFFVSIVWAAGGGPPAEYAAPLAIVLIASWLPGVAAGALTWWAIGRGR